MRAESDNEAYFNFGTEVMAYSDVAIQGFAQEANFWIYADDGSWAKTQGTIPAENVLSRFAYGNYYFGIAQNDSVGPYFEDPNYEDTSPCIEIIFKVPIMVSSVTVLPQIADCTDADANCGCTDSNGCSGVNELWYDSWDNGYDVWAYGPDDEEIYCGWIDDLKSYREVQCEVLAKSISVDFWWENPNRFFAVATIGIFSECKCSETDISTSIFEGIGLEMPNLVYTV